MKDNAQTDKTKLNWCRTGGRVETSHYWSALVICCVFCVVKVYKKDSFEPELNQRPMDFCMNFLQLFDLLQSTALPTELSKVILWYKWTEKLQI